MQFNTDRLRAVIEAKNLSIIMLVHDNFSLHEQYAICLDQNTGVYHAFIYVAPDDHLEESEFDNGASAFTYVMTTAFATFGASINKNESDIEASLECANALRNAAVDLVRHNVAVNNSRLLERNACALFDLIAK